MNIKKYILLPLFISCLSGCNLPNGSDNYLKLGDTITLGDYSQRLTEFNYIPSVLSSKNNVVFQLVFDLHYSGEKITNFAPRYNAIFDGDEKSGGYSFIDSSNTPSSIAPNDSISLTLGFKCFKDWKEVNISYHYNDNLTSSFKMRSSDFGFPTNNLFPTLKPGESITTSNSAASVKIKGIERTIIGSGNSNEYDNVLASFVVTNHTNEKIGFSKFNFTFDSNFSDGSISWSSDTQPTSVNAKESVSFELILKIRTKDWKTCVVMVEFPGTTLKFNLSHNDYNY